MDDPLSPPLFVALLTGLTLALLLLAGVRAVWLRVPIGDLLVLKRSYPEHRALLEELLSHRRTLALAVSLLQALFHSTWLLLWAWWLWPPPWPEATFILALLGLLMVLVLVEEGLSERLTRHWRIWTLRLAPVARWLTRTFAPLMRLWQMLFRNGAPAQAFTLSQETFMALLEASGSPQLAPPLLRMVYAVLRMRQTLVREIMVPRIDMVVLDIDTPLREALRTFIQTGFSRLPVYRERVDHIVGVLYSKDLLERCLKGDWDRVAIRDIMRPPYFVPEAKRVDELLQEMQARRIHMAIVVDEYGGVAGLVTLEDIVEEIVGEILDEYDRPVVAYQRISENEYVFNGRIDLDDFNDIMGVRLDRNVADTLGGFIFTRLGRIPEEGEELREGPLILRVEKVEGRRIVQVRVRKQPPATQENEGTS